MRDRYQKSVHERSESLRGADAPRHGETSFTVRRGPLSVVLVLLLAAGLWFACGLWDSPLRLQPQKREEAGDSAVPDGLSLQPQKQEEASALEAPVAAGGLWLQLQKMMGIVPEWDIARVRSTLDANGNGVCDTDDILRGAREETARRPIYRSAYYAGGYPPEGEGVCTDVIWRAWKAAGYDLKKLVDADIRANPGAYPRAARPEPNIDFRRVPNLNVYFARHGLSLTTNIVPGDKENLALWQPGDIVVFANPDHIAILSDVRNGEGIPLLLHNAGPVAAEEDAFMLWYGKGIVGHYRFPSR